MKIDTVKKETSVDIESILKLSNTECKINEIASFMKPIMESRHVEVTLDEIKQEVVSFAKHQTGNNNINEAIDEVHDKMQEEGGIKTNCSGISF